MLYTSDWIFDEPHKDEVDQAIQGIKNAKINITIEGYLQDLFGIKIDSKQDESINLRVFPARDEDLI